MPENEKGPAGLAIVLQGFFHCLPESFVNSKILVVTGIEHSTDDLLCKQVAFHVNPKLI